MIIYIDFASVGDANFYRLQWEKSLKDSQKKHYNIFTDFKYSFNSKYLSLPHIFSSCNFLNNLLKFLSQFLTIFLIIIYVTLSKKNKIVIFNLHQPFVYWQWLKFIKKTNVKVIGIIHDIIEFDTSQYPPIIISTNKKIISNLDAVILHEGESFFRNEYKFAKSIYTLPFPNRKPYEYQEPILNFKYFLLPGRYRKEKGFDFVISNWPINKNTMPLVVMTKVPIELESIITSNYNIKYYPNLNKTDSFVNLILNCTTAILMYTNGTNSGILQTLIANQKKVITSKISIFTSSINCDDFIFCENDPVEFQELISNFNLSNYSQYYRVNNEDKSNECYENFLKQIFD